MSASTVPSPPVPVPFVDLTPATETIRREVLAEWTAVLEEGRFIGGPRVEAFEKAFAAFTGGVAHAIGVANGTDALEVALRALEVAPGDEVIIPANTFIATPLAVLRAGATPVFVDVDEDSLLMTADAVEPAVTPRTRVLVPVHLYGQMAPMRLLGGLAERHGLRVIEDFAQAQGARRDGQNAGAVGDVNATSFYPGKNLGAFGDAGAVVSDDDMLADRCRALRNYGSPRKYEHPEVGFNSRLDPVQAVVLAAKLRHLGRWNEARRRVAARYDRLLDELLPEVHRLSVPEGSEPVWHLYPVRVPHRDRVKERLEARGIGVGVHYPTPCHLTGAMASLGHRPGAFPVSERAAERLLSLPMYPQLTEGQQVRVVEALAAALRHGR